MKKSPRDLLRFPQAAGDVEVFSRSLVVSDRAVGAIARQILRQALHLGIVGLELDVALHQGQQVLVIPGLQGIVDLLLEAHRIVEGVTSLLQQPPRLFRSRREGQSSQNFGDLAVMVFLQEFAGLFTGGADLASQFCFCFATGNSAFAHPDVSLKRGDWRSFNLMSKEMAAS